jgi:mRNA interferase MazF
MKKGTIWMVDLPEGQGHEQKGQRPAIVVGSANGLVVVIPLTSSTERAALSHTEVIEPSRENGLANESVALVFQIKSIDKNRLQRKIGEAAKEDLRKIDMLMADLLGMAKR